MVDPATPQADPSWLSLRLSQWRKLVVRCGPRLLAVELIITVASVAPFLPLLLGGTVPDTTATVVALALALSAVVGSFLTAWSWSAALTILSQDPSDGSARIGIGQALRAGLRSDGLRAVLRLWGWLMLMEVFSLPSLLIFRDVDLAMAYLSSPFSTLLDGLSWYVAFATALLPMAIVLERRGIARAWQLTHSRLSTAVGIVALFAADLAVEQIVDQLRSGLVETLSSIAIGIPLTVLLTVAYYVIYRAHTEATSGGSSAAPLSHEDSGAEA